VKVWVLDGEMPYPEWPDADIVFVLHPPPLDIPVLAEVWKHSRTVVLVSHKADTRLAGQETHPLCEFFALSDNTCGAILLDLLHRQDTVFFLSFQKRRPWYLDWLPQVERDALVVDGKHFRFHFDAYTSYEGSFEFDDAYRRVSLNECTFAQSTNHFLHVLETLPYTAIADAQTKKSLFQGLFPFYTGQPLSPDIYFAWRGTPEPLRTAILGAELSRHTAPYALAIACLSEVGAAFTHRGRHEDYLALMGDLLRLYNGQITVGAFTPEQRAWLRQAHPFLSLHVFYRVPNQFLVATMDTIRDALHNTEIIAAAEDLLHRLMTQESTLHFVKRTYELTALSGTLCQLKIFAARYHGNRPQLLAAKEDGLRAAHYARPDDVSRDMNYWIQAVLTDWVLFPEQVQQHPAEAGHEYVRIVEVLRGHLQHEPESYYNLMVVHLAAAVEAAYRQDTQIRALFPAFGLGPQTLTALFTRAEYDSRRIGSYALCLAAGYAALLCPTLGWEVEMLAVPMDQAQRFFFTMAEQHGGREGVILRVVALKHAACRLFYLHTRRDFAGVAAEASVYLARLHDLVPPLTAHATLVRFFETARVQPEALEVPEMLRVIFTLPY
jgi:hypothetical protein